MLLACRLALVDSKVDEGLTVTGTAISSPRAAETVELTADFFAMALGSNFPAYGVISSIAGDFGDAKAGD